MTEIYFVRHSKPDFSIKEDALRPLTREGKLDSKKVTNYLLEKNISRIYSSPYKRAIETIKDFSHISGLEIEMIEDFRERKVSDIWIYDFDSFAKKQWEDFNYKLLSGESLTEVQIRNIRFVEKILEENEAENIVISGHGTALSTIINYYDKSFKYKDFKRIQNIMPFIVHFKFNKNNINQIEKIIV